MKKVKNLKIIDKNAQGAIANAMLIAKTICSEYVRCDSANFYFICAECS